ncbi:hypothetical protein [Enterococcus gallinarum]|uniref:hypothetical protein n=1 Tax=Enterococcus gallinarum TaxID=1353 RepID=UPI001C54E7B6|nr:hypothetical protein [Enterococcus gallinarum]
MKLMKKVTLVTTLLLALFFGASASAEVVTVNVTEGAATFTLATPVETKTVDFADISFTETKANPLTGTFTLSGTLTNKSFGAKQVVITAAVPGETSAPGLTIATSEVFKVEASQGYETTEEGTFDYTIDPSTFDNTKASDYVITLTASEVTDFTP